MTPDMTPLDAAFAAALEDSERIGDYYSLFMRSMIFIPTYGTSSGEDGMRRTEEGDTFSPAILVIEDDPTLFIFDSEERLVDFTSGVDEIERFIAIPGHALLESLPPITLVLNPGTEHSKEFPSEEVAFLKERMQASGPRVEIVEAGTAVHVGAPATIPDGLEDALREVLARNPEVTRAHLGQIAVDVEGRRPELALVARTSGVSEEVRAAIMKELGIAARGRMGESDSMTLFVDQDNGTSEQIEASTEPFYTV